MDETLSAYAPQDTPFTLILVDDKETQISASLILGKNGEVSGRAPCNGYFGKTTVPYPWFQVETIGATKMACPNLSDETDYFNRLKSMTLSEVSGDTLILSNDEGQNLVFKTRE